MKFTQLFTVSALATLAVATPTGGSPPAGATCCKQVGTVSDPAVAKELGLLGIVLQGVTAVIGLNCSPITVIGNGNGCNNGGTAVTCTSTSHGGLVNVGCVPITL